MLLFSLFSFFLGLLCVEGGPGDTFLLAGSSAPMLFSFPALQMVGLQYILLPCNKIMIIMAFGIWNIGEEKQSLN